MKGSLLLLLLLGGLGSTAFAQLGDAGAILQGGKEDAQLLLREYLKPFGKGYGPAMNTGWNDEAKPHKTLGFSISIRSGLAMVPGSDQSFDVTAIGLQELSYDSGPTVTPTINGTDNAAPTRIVLEKQVQGQTYTFADFNMPQGTGFSYVPSPLLQVGIGTIKDTELDIRYMPETKIPSTDVHVNMIGLALKHGINQWLPGGKYLPVDLSVMAGYSENSITSGFDVQPYVDNDTYNDYPASTWDGQKADITTSAFTLDALVGKSLPFISVFGGVGFETSKMTIKTPGSYPLTVPNENYDPNATQGPNSYPKIVEDLKDPIDTQIDGANSVHALAGFTVKMAVFHITGSYTVGSYSVANVGIGFSFR